MRRPRNTLDEAQISNFKTKTNHEKLLKRLRIRQYFDKQGRLTDSPTDG
jgi:hypothetical protein